jgi:small-conductance mechanosensitive channel
MTFEERNQTPPEAATPRWVGIVVVLIAVVSLVALGIGWSAERTSKDNETAMASQVQAAKQAQSVLEQRLQQSDETNAQMQGELNVITDRLKLTQGELATARVQARKITAEDGKQFAAMKQQEDQLNTQLATKASSDDLNKVSGDVTGVKTDLDATKQNLQMARDQFGNLIARNHDEIAELRRLGERDIFEFTVDKKNEKKHVGDLTVELRSTNTKKQLFTMYLFVDDKRFEKNNRSVDEPIYFYTHEYQVPLEMVINQVGKNKVTGYLSVPKAAAPAPTASGSTGTGSGQ